MDNDKKIPFDVGARVIVVDPEAPEVNQLGTVEGVCDSTTASERDVRLDDAPGLTRWRVDQLGAEPAPVG